ncbi:adenylate/guanylate cyclase domain-containing protein [Dietzia alimentaria]|uniref:adenylate/guanylate cyclase domain-containing protein n=1 Tax=Dietzia alimentaria TaxID=665550 RepID=UPI000299EB51|nr:adenylate/guanylate cyclase domain-containing protein [Dietzia alimentaria]
MMSTAPGPIEPSEPAARPAAPPVAQSVPSRYWARTRQVAARVGASAREANRSPASVDFLRHVRRALPGDSGFGDPLSAAGRDGAGTIARLAGRLFDEQPTASREVTLGGLQLWHSLRERAGRGEGGSEVTIVFTDLVGFSDWALRVGDEEALHLLRRVAAATEPAVVAHRGTVVKRLGDGLMAVFPSPQLALNAVTDLMSGVAEVEVGGWRPKLRVGIHTGHPRRIGDDYLGVDVNIAARLGEKAGAGEILVSETTRAGLDPARVSTRPKRSFRPGKVKGVPEGIAVHVATPR